MKGLLRTSALAALILVATSARSSANVLFTLENVELVVGTSFAGYLNGSFTTNDDRDQLLSVNITADANTTNGHINFGDKTYTLGTGTTVDDSHLPYTYFQLDVVDQSGKNGLRLTFDSLTATTIQIHSGSSYEWQGSIDDYRSVASETTVKVTQLPNGPVTAPEPSSLAMAGIAAMAGLAVRGRRRRGRRTS